MKTWKFYLLYKITNLVNNKIYIGMHRTDNENDNYWGSSSYLQEDIRKYGKRQFKKEILEYCSSDLELREKEATYVNQKFIERDDTYNLRKGGGYNKNLDYNEVSYRRTFYFSKKMKDEEYYDKFCNIIKQSLSDPKVRYRISDGIKLHIEQYGSWWDGKKHKEETKLKIGKANSISQKGERNSQYGTMWVTDDKTSLKIKVNDKIPEGWRKGRICKKVKE